MFKTVGPIDNISIIIDDIYYIEIPIYPCAQDDDLVKSVGNSYLVNGSKQISGVLVPRPYTGHIGLTVTIF